MKALQDDLAKPVKSAGPATPVEVLGLSDVPQAGDVFYGVEDPKVAREIASRRTEALKDNRLVGAMKHITLDNLFDQIKEGADQGTQSHRQGRRAGVRGSPRPVPGKTLDRKGRPQGHPQRRGEHRQFGHPAGLRLQRHRGGFQRQGGLQRQGHRRERDVDVRVYKIIYDAVEDVRKAMEGLLEPTYRQVSIGRAEVRQLFNTPKGTIAGSMVMSGKITSKAKVKVLRGEEMVYEGALTSLRRFKDDVKEVNNGFECGIGIEGFDDIQVGDQLEAYILEAVAQKLED